MMGRQSRRIEVAMRQLKIDLSELEIAFDSGGEMISYYLDLETGEVISVSDEERELLESIYESYYDEQSQTVDWESAFEKEHVPDWQREQLQIADRVEAGFGSRFIAIPSEGTQEGYRDMEAFIATVHCSALARAPGPCHQRAGRFSVFQRCAAGLPHRAGALVPVQEGSIAATDSRLVRGAWDNPNSMIIKIGVINMAKKPTQIYQIKVTLNDTHPPIWRRIQVPGNTTLLKLHDILQIVMGWEDYHLHMFTIEGSIYGDPADDEYGDLGTIDEANYKLNQVIDREGQRFTYEYDFGDSWDHTLLVEKILPPQEGVRYPICLKGKRACPPEDVGGVWGYENFLEAIRDPEP